MQTKLQDIDSLLRDLESEFSNLRLYYEGKQSDRVFSNNIWVLDKLERTLLAKAKPLQESFKEIKAIHNPEALPSLQFDSPITHTTNIIKLLQELQQVYKMYAPFGDIKMKLGYNMPKLNQEISHLRNRFMILKGNLTRQKKFDEEESFW